MYLAVIKREVITFFMGLKSINDLFYVFIYHSHIIENKILRGGDKYLTKYSTELLLYISSSKEK